MLVITSAIMSLRSPVYYIGNQAPGIVTISKKIKDGGDGKSDYEMIFTPSQGGYCYYQTRRAGTVSYEEDMMWLKRGSTNEKTVSPMIHP